MTIPELITVWQAQPFRPFRMHTTRGIFDVAFPWQFGLTPTMRVALVVEGTRAETFALDEIERCEPTGDAVDLATLMGGLAPETVGQAAQILATATSDPVADAAAAQEVAQRFDPGRVTFLTATEKATGIFLVYAVVTTGDGAKKMFSNVGTRWNVHGVERFENGTTVYLHHLDHPTIEQRVILWPPHHGTFDSFAEATTPEALLQELQRRDATLSAKPATPFEPKAAYFRSILPEYPLPPPRRRTEAAAFDEDADPAERDRYTLQLVPLDLGGGRIVQNPVLKDAKLERTLFDLTHTPWDAGAARVGRDWRLTLRHGSYAGKSFELHIACERHTARIDADRRALPLAFIERHFRNFTLYTGWDLMFATLRAGPVKRHQPDVVVPLAGGFRVEMWAGWNIYPVPFLQPRIIDPDGRTVFDLRTSGWAAAIRPYDDRPALTLVPVSEARADRDGSTARALVLDLITHRVTCPGVEGATTIGLLQGWLHQFRGAAWARDELPKFLSKGRLVPGP